MIKAKQPPCIALVMRSDGAANQVLVQTKSGSGLEQQWCPVTPCSVTKRLNSLWWRQFNKFRKYKLGSKGHPHPWRDGTQLG
jgi:hypothetical protein